MFMSTLNLIRGLLAKKKIKKLTLKIPEMSIASFSKFSEHAVILIIRVHLFQGD